MFLRGFEWSLSENENHTLIYTYTGGLTRIFKKIGDPEDIFWGCYFSCTRSQGVAALVSQSGTIVRRAGLSKPGNLHKILHIPLLIWCQIPTPYFVIGKLLLPKLRCSEGGEVVQIKGKESLWANRVSNFILYWPKGKQSTGLHMNFQYIVFVNHANVH